MNFECKRHRKYKCQKTNTNVAKVAGAMSTETYQMRVVSHHTRRSGKVRSEAGKPRLGQVPNHFGTRSSTLLLIRIQGDVRPLGRSFPPHHPLLHCQTKPANKSPIMTFGEDSRLQGSGGDESGALKARKACSAYGPCQTSIAC